MTDGATAIPPSALIMPGPSWALSEVKDTVPLEGRAAFYDMLFTTMGSRKYAEITDLPAPWREPVMDKYREWQTGRGTMTGQPGAFDDVNKTGGEARLGLWTREMIEGVELPSTGRKVAATVFGEIRDALPALLLRMLGSEQTLALLLEISPPPGPYVQAQTNPADKSIVAECVSNEFLQGMQRLTADQEEELPSMGWQWPAPPNQPNWRSFAIEPGGSLDISVLLDHTLRRIFGCSDDSPIGLIIYRGIGPYDPPPTSTFGTV